jgi:hypothetical protein
MTAGAPSRDGRLLYAAVDDRRLYAIDRKGNIRWRTYLGRRPGSELRAAPEGMLTLTDESGGLLLLNERGGIIWERSIPGGYAGSVTGPNGTVYIAAGDTLQAVSHSGVLRWKRSLPARPAAEPVFSPRYGLLVPCSDDFLRCYSPGGVLRWEFRAAGTPGKPVLQSDGIYLPNAAGTVALVSSEGHLLRQFRDTGRTTFAAPADSGILAVAGRELLRLSPDGERETAGQISFTPLAGSGEEGRIALFGRQGAAAVLPASGLAVRELTIPPATALPVFFGDALLAVGGKDWIVYAYRCSFRDGSSGSRHDPAVERPADGMPADGETADAMSAEGPGGSNGSRERRESRASSAGRVSAAALMREALLGSGDRSMLKELLDRAEEVLKSRSPQKGELEYLRAAEAVLTEGVLNPKFRDGRLINDFPELRRQAAELIGRHGDLYSRRPLFELLRYEWASGGVTETVHALASLGGTGDGEGIAFLLRKLRSGSSVSGDALAAAAIEYVRKEFRYHGILRRESVELLQTIYLGGYGREVRLRAAEALRGLKRDA